MDHVLGHLVLHHSESEPLLAEGVASKDKHRTGVVGFFFCFFYLQPAQGVAEGLQPGRLFQQLSTRCHCRTNKQTLSQEGVSVTTVPTDYVKFSTVT